MMFDSNKQLVAFALQGWAQHIETGNFSGMDKKTILSLAKNDNDMQRVANKLPVLTRDQQELIYRLQDLASEVLMTGEIER